MILTPGTLAIVIGVALILIVALLWKPIQRWTLQSETDHAVDLFKVQREQLEAKFLDLARAAGKPRGLRWTNCDWNSDVTFGRAVDSGLLTAFVSINISFEAIEGGDMEDVEAVGLLRDAVAVFHFRNGGWGTGGRALFNMNPNDAIERLQGQFEPISVGV
ncbi:MAG: hypothetical protein CMJ78_27465 [Planctomycetaceae bacterium]|nr:hypothetical protein [Planctomycetaceae bacterium]